MHPAVSLVAENVAQNQRLVIPLLFVALAATANLHSPVQHSLLVTCVSWAVVWIYAVFRAGLLSSSGARKRAISAWVAGALLALSVICDRAACDREGIWSTKGLLPLLVILLSTTDLVPRLAALPTYMSDDDSPADSTLDEKRPPTRSHRIIAVATVSASIALATRYNLSSTTALGLSSVIFAAIALVLLENALRATKDESGSGNRGFVSANGSFSRRISVSGTQTDQQFASLRDVSLIMAVLCGLATWIMEPVVSNDAMTFSLSHVGSGNWKALHYRITVTQILLMTCAKGINNVLMFIMLPQQGAVHISFLALFSFVCARLSLAFSFSGLWFTTLYALSALFFLHSSSYSSFVDIRSSVRYRRLFFGVTILSTGLFLLYHISAGPSVTILPHDTSTFHVRPPESQFAPVPIDLNKGHPALQMTSSSENEFQNVVDRQSKSLAEAVQEYRRRNGIAPPPHFDKWYEFATRNKVVLIDEFDTITESLLPFWALKPSTIRERLKHAIGHDDSALVAAAIRDGSVVKIEGGDEWQQQATTGMMKEFVHLLPDMDLGFNIHDEPRVIVPNDQLSVMVAKARDEVLPRIAKNTASRNSYSSRPADLNSGRLFEESKTTKFNRFAHQQTWTHSRLSCPVDSQAQIFEDSATDNFTTYAAGPLSYIYNHTAFSDICNSPSLSSTFGFFERPNAFSIIHELTPVFSQSKISSFQDILYPSPWYWFGKVAYDESRDTKWENKTNSLYWRGSTTGGFSRDGGWRRQHRQHIVKRLNALDKAEIITSNEADSTHALEEIDRKSLAHLIDVKFSSVGQCDPGDCDAQNEFFQIVDRVDGQDAWYYKHLLDMDGNAFSGRFYSFLRSKSLIYKMAMFREWHQEWLRPWVHYIPLTLIGDEHLDLVRWFSGDTRTESGEHDKKGGNGDSVGERKARDIAERSRDWAGKVLRNEDFEAWFFRLLLEYGRIIDDNREEIGYPGP